MLIFSFFTSCPSVLFNSLASFSNSAGIKLPSNQSGIPTARSHIHQVSSESSLRGKEEGQGGYKKPADTGGMLVRLM